MRTAIIALLLLLAGCAPVPKPPQESMPVRSSESVTLKVDEEASTIAERLETERIAHLGSFVALRSRRKEVEALQRQRDKLLVQAKRMDVAFRALEMVAAQCLGSVNRDCSWGQQVHPPEWVDVRDLASGAISVRMSGEKGITIHHEGGSWCNVWADSKGIHWEECK